MDKGRIKMTPEKILDIANKKGTFEVSWRYRDRYLLNICFKLVKEKKFKLVKYKAGSYKFKLKKNPCDNGNHKFNNITICFLEDESKIIEKCIYCELNK
jgi:hypothetical protein